MFLVRAVVPVVCVVAAVVSRGILGCLIDLRDSYLMNVEAVHKLFCTCLHDDFAILKEPEGVWLVVVFAAPLGGGLKPGEGGEQSHCELRGRERFLAQHFSLLRYLCRGGKN